MNRGGHTSRKPVGSGSFERPFAEYSSPLGQLQASPYINSSVSSTLTDSKNQEFSTSEEFFDTLPSPTLQGTPTKTQRSNSKPADSKGLPSSTSPQIRSTTPLTKLYDTYQHAAPPMHMAEHNVENRQFRANGDDQHNSYTNMPSNSNQPQQQIQQRETTNEWTKNGQPQLYSYDVSRPYYGQTDERMSLNHEKSQQNMPINAQNYSAQNYAVQEYGQYGAAQEIHHYTQGGPGFDEAYGNETHLAHYQPDSSHEISQHSKNVAEPLNPSSVNYQSQEGFIFDGDYDSYENNSKYHDNALPQSVPEVRQEIPFNRNADPNSSDYSLLNYYEENSLGENVAALRSSQTVLSSNNSQPASSEGLAHADPYLPFTQLSNNSGVSNISPRNSHSHSYAHRAPVPNSQHYAQPGTHQNSEFYAQRDSLSSHRSSSSREVPRTSSDLQKDAALGIGMGSAYVQRLRFDSGETYINRKPALIPLGLRRSAQNSPLNVKPEFLRKALDIKYKQLPQRMLETEVDDDDNEVILPHSSAEKPNAIETRLPTDNKVAESTSSRDAFHLSNGSVDQSHRSSSPVDSIVEQTGRIKLFVANPDGN